MGGRAKNRPGRRPTPADPPQRGGDPHGAADPDPPAGWVERWGLRAAIVTVVTGVVVGVVVAVVVARVPSPEPPGPTRVAVSTAPRSPSGSGTSGSAVAGRWTSAPVTLSNDYLSARFSMDPSASCQGATGWEFGTPAAGLPPLPFGGDANRWAAEHGGVPASDNYLTVLVQGLNGHTVVITRIGVRVVQRRTPTAATSPHLSGGCGGITPSSFQADLDRPGDDLDTVAVEGDGVGTPAPAVPLPHQVSEAEPEQWQITLHTTTCDCTVLPYFEWTSDGATGRFDLALPVGAWEVTAPAVNAVDVYRNDEAGTWSAE